MSETTTLQPVPAWVREFCSTDDTIRVALNAPFSIEYEGAPAIAATNGHKLLVLPGAFDVDAPPSAPSNVAALVRDALSRPTRRVRLDVLREFCEVKPLGWPCASCDGAGTVTCGACDGTGEAEHECSCGDLHDAPCEVCDEDGKVRCVVCRGGNPCAFAIQPVDLGGVHFNRALLGDVVRALPGDGAVTWHDGLYTIEAHAGKAAALAGDGWVALVMPITRRTEPPPDFTAWEVEA
jgi:hypothetical protein